MRRPREISTDIKLEKDGSEMKIDKRLLVALALAACLLTVTATVASGAVWKDNHSNLTNQVPINVTGGEVFETGSGGMSCEVLGTITAQSGSTGTITKWEVKNCSGGFGNLAGCEVGATQPTGTPWTLHVEAADIKVTNMRIRRTFKAGCPVSEIEKVVTMTLTPIPLTTATEFEFHGNNGTYTSFGSLTIDAPNSGTYGIG
jgi:hypothetical protein